MKEQDDCRPATSEMNVSFYETPRIVQTSFYRVAQWTDAFQPCSEGIPKIHHVPFRDQKKHPDVFA